MDTANWLLNFDDYSAGLLQLSAGLLNSTFMTSLVGAFAGAWGGAFIVERSNKKASIVQRIRSTNGAIAISVGMLNSFGALKNQHTRRMSAQYFGDRHRILEEIACGSQPIHFQYDLMILSEVSTPAESFRNLMLHDVGNTGRALGASMELLVSIQNLNEAMRTRNALIEEFRSKGVTPDRYFGFAGSSSTDVRYCSVMEGITKYNDDCIFFTNLVVEDLQRHGKILQKKFGRNAPPISETSSDKAKSLIPSAAEYDDWLAGWKDREDN